MAKYISEIKSNLIFIFNIFIIVFSRFFFVCFLCRWPSSSFSCSYNLYQKYQFYCILLNKYTNTLPNTTSMVIQFLHSTYLYLTYIFFSTWAFLGSSSSFLGNWFTIFTFFYNLLFSFVWFDWSATFFCIFYFFVISL